MTVFFGTRLSSIVADAVVLALTWVKTIRYRDPVVNATAIFALAEVLLTDGVVYFS
ncbi:hypothetical protein SCP_0114260 [Sparassis crispa]|uniref:Uncharacterized protein n=1 Tax=Sparassis crispa TaxID=139825 RepID=A0A401G8Q3_9APHY|nr:hypothetical protein SCP_0114260 [Sparassis crispa]GBE78537.1 hypothetical protein SCP_0114260 [Sparassis crispa]